MQKINSVKPPLSEEFQPVLEGARNPETTQETLHGLEGAYEILEDSPVKIQQNESEQEAPDEGQVRSQADAKETAQGTSVKNEQASISCQFNAKEAFFEFAESSQFEFEDPTKPLPPRPSILPRIEMERELAECSYQLIEHRILVIECAVEEVGAAAAYGLLELVQWHGIEKRFVDLAPARKEREELILDTFAQHKVGGKGLVAVLVRTQGASLFLDSLMVDDLTAFSYSTQLKQIGTVLIVQIQPSQLRHLPASRGESFQFPRLQVPFLRSVLRKYLVSEAAARLEGVICEQRTLGLWGDPENDEDFYREIAPLLTIGGQLGLEREIERRRAEYEGRSPKVEIAEAPISQPSEAGSELHKTIPLVDELARVFDSEPAATGLLERAGVPRERLRPFGQMTLLEYWELVCRELEKGLIAGGLAALVTAAIDSYPHNETFERALKLVAPLNPPGGPDNEDGSPLAGKLDELYKRREALAIAGNDTRALDREIRDVRRLLRKGPQLQPGEFLAHGRFKLVDSLGQGGFATVWKAYDRQRKSLVAVKVLHGQHSADRSKRERFFRGARRMAELQHPNVVQVVEKEMEDDGWYFFVMELVGGRDFGRAILDGDLTEGQKLAIVRRVGAALEHAHSKGVVHRDVKPANVLLDGELQPKLTDFDLVRADDSTGFTQTRAMLGTLLYAAPELLESPRDAGPPADVYGLASTLVFALRGKALPAGYYRDPGRAISELGGPLAGVLARATAAEAERRYPSVRDFLEAVDKATAQRLAKDL